MALVTVFFLSFFFVTFLVFGRGGSTQVFDVDGVMGPSAPVFGIVVVEFNMAEDEECDLDMAILVRVLLGAT